MKNNKLTLHFLCDAYQGSLVDLTNDIDYGTYEMPFNELDSFADTIFEICSENNYDGISVKQISLEDIYEYEWAESVDVYTSKLGLLNLLEEFPKHKKEILRFFELPQDFS
jgi:hypothetical protein